MLIGIEFHDAALAHRFVAATIAQRRDHELDAQCRQRRAAGAAADDHGGRSRFCTERDDDKRLMQSGAEVTIEVRGLLSKWLGEPDWRRAVSITARMMRTFAGRSRVTSVRALDARMTKNRCESSSSAARSASSCCSRTLRTTQRVRGRYAAGTDYTGSCWRRPACFSVCRGRGRSSAIGNSGSCLYNLVLIAIFILISRETGNPESRFIAIMLCPLATAAFVNWGTRWQAAMALTALSGYAVGRILRADCRRHTGCIAGWVSSRR